MSKKNLNSLIKISKLLNQLIVNDQLVGFEYNYKTKWLKDFFISHASINGDSIQLGITTNEKKHKRDLKIAHRILSVPYKRSLAYHDRINFKK